MKTMEPEVALRTEHSVGTAELAAGVVDVESPPEKSFNSEDELQDSKRALSIATGSKQVVSDRGHSGEKAMEANARDVHPHHTDDLRDKGVIGAVERIPDEYEVCGDSGEEVLQAQSDRNEVNPSSLVEDTHTPYTEQRTFLAEGPPKSIALMGETQQVHQREEEGLIEEEPQLAVDGIGRKKSDILRSQELKDDPPASALLEAVAVTDAERYDKPVKIEGDFDESGSVEGSVHSRWSLPGLGIGGVHEQRAVWAGAGGDEDSVGSVEQAPSSETGGRGSDGKSPRSRVESYDLQQELVRKDPWYRGVLAFIRKCERGDVDKILSTSGMSMTVPAGLVSIPQLHPSSTRCRK